jgi:N-acetylglucosamine kinase-like BadF-type ATPase
MIVHDAAPLLARVPADESAIALICGTGSFAWGRDAQGNTARAGGWGPALGDEGSGYWIGLIGLRAVLRAVDGRGPATSLTQSLAGLLEMSDWSELPARFRTFSRERLAALAPHVIAAAQARDAVARALLHEAGRQLAEIVLAVSTSLQCRGSLGRLVMAGSVLLQSQTLRRQVVQWLEQHGLDIRHVEQVAEPAEGALELARQALTR